MPKNCLIIDDNPQNAIAENIESRLNKGRIVHAQCYQFNVGSEERRDLLTNEEIDIEKVKAQFEKEFDGMHLDLICIDYNLDDKNTDGLDILKEIFPLRKSSMFMIYSSNLDQVVKEIIDGYDEDKDKKKLLRKIKFLTKYKITDFVARDNYDDAVIKLLSKEPQTLESIIEEKLLEFPELVFQHTYPLFEGRTLKEIAREIRSGTLHGNNYTKELIEVAISNMVLINNI